MKAQTDARADKEAMDAAQKVYESRQKLYKDGALARKLVDDAQVAYAQARSQYEAARAASGSTAERGQARADQDAAAQVETAKAHYQGAEAQLAYSEIRSPDQRGHRGARGLSGRDGQRGRAAADGDGCFESGGAGEYSAEPGGLLEGGRRGHGDRPAARTEGALQGKVTVVSPAVDPNSTTVQVWVETANPGERLKPGITVHVSVVAATIRDAVVVPAAALLPADDGGTQVMVVGADAVAHARKIETGARETGTKCRW